jgi:PhzF family phenazine biosynthesis protein
MKTFIVDAFTDRPFRGNPAGVCLTEAPLAEEMMLLIAQELNLSETAFVRSTDVPGHFAIRFFSPKMEIALCGHATLASARVVQTTYGLGDAHFLNSQGLDLATRSTSDHVTMSFPRYTTAPAVAPPALLSALGIRALVNAVYNQETRILMLEIADAETLARLTPDYAALLRSHSGINGVLVTARGGTEGYDFHSRYFWPWSGTDEDPVTGGTHTFLTGYWSERLGKTRMRSFQSSRRSGFMNVELGDDHVLISGQAVIVFEGRLVF